MHTQPILHTRRSLATAALMLATFATGTSFLHAQTLTGDYRVLQDGSEPGNLDADGDLGWGRTPGSPGAVAGKLRYFDSPAQLAFDATEADAIFTWNDDATDTLRDFKMKLDANNVLSLYKTDGSAASISLTPDTGAIKLSGTGAGLFNGSGGGVLQIDGSGRPYFATKPIFQDGVDFGSGGTLDSSKVQYLQGLFTQLGYDPNESTYTDVTRLNVSPNLSIGKAVYANGYVYWVGYFTGPVTIGGNLYNESGGRTIIVKSSPTGTVSWVRQIATKTPQTYLTLSSIDVNASGTVVVGGQFTGEITNLGALNLTAATTSADGFILVLNSSGTPQWSKAISGTASPDAPSDYVYGVAIDSSGNVAAAGQTHGSTINLGTGTLTCTAGAGEGFAVRYNSSGTASWAMLAGGSGSNESLKHVDIAPSGDVLLAGSGGTTTNLGSLNITGAGGNDAWVASVSSGGTLQWTKGIGGTGMDEARGISVDASGNVYVAASFNGTTTTLGSYNKTSAGNVDGLVAKLNSSGTVQWATAIGGTAGDYPNHLTLDSAGAILVSGQIDGSTTNLGAYNITGKGGTDGFAVTLDSSGAVTSAQAIGGTGNDGVNSASPLGSLSSGLFVTGWAGANANVGDTRIPTGSYAFSVPQSSIVTRAAATVTGLDWNGGLATSTEGVAIGSKAYSQGEGAVAMGQSSAVGAWSFSSGSSRAHGDYSLAMGMSTNAVGTNSTAFGSYSWAVGNNSFAVGEGSNAMGLSSSALGAAAQALGDYSFAGGWVATASGSSAVALGEFTEARGYASVALGGYNVAEGEFSTTLGADTRASGSFSLAGGLSSKAESYVSTALGQGNIGGGHPTNWVDTDPLFEIGNMNSTTRSNAVTTLKNGSTTLTNRAWKAAVTADPTEALDDPEDANDSGGKALVVEGHTDLQGRVTIRPQGDLSMDGFTD